MGIIETFYERQRYYAKPIQFINDVIIIILPIVLVILALYPAGILHTDGRLDMTAFIVGVVGALAILAIKLVTYHSKPSFIVEMASFLLYHLVVFDIALFVLGVQTPLDTLYIILYVISYIIFGVFGFILSIFFFGFLVISDIFLNGDTSWTYVSIGASFFVFITIVGYATSFMVKLTANSEKDLEKTRTEEEKQRDRLDALVNSMAEGVLSITKDGLVRLQNAAVLSVLDTNVRLVGKHIDDVLNLVDGENKPVKIKDILKNTHKIMERTDLRHKFNSDDSMNLKIQISPIRSNFGDAAESDQDYVMLISDITKQKSLDEERDEFISVVSHELRTPVATAEGSIGNLVFMQEKGVADQETAKTLAKDAHQKIVFLASMINDLATLSRAEHGTADEVEEVDISALCQDLYEKYREQAKQKGLVLNLDVSSKLPNVLQSRLYLEETLQNFLNNALKYTEKGSITIRAHITKAGVECSISDTGMGISASDQKKLFEKFFRSEDWRIRETGGTGLGLYVVKKLTAKMGVKVKVKSRLNHGSSFSIILDSSNKKKRILG
jgi:two-component system phosphate regulon sensor histidine kinase PhoR